MCLKRFASTICPNCHGHQAYIGSGLRECEQCGRIRGDQTMTTAAKPQPMPTAGRQDVLPEVIADLQSRDAVGRKKYGTTLQTHNGRDALMDAYQEALDQVMYLKQALLEKGSPMPVHNWPETVFAVHNVPETQLQHISTEVDEIDALYPCDVTETMALHMELADLQHSIETFWRILGRIKGEDYVAAVFMAVENKNRERGYYDVDYQSESVDRLEGPFGQMPNLEP